MKVYEILPGKLFQRGRPYLKQLEELRQFDLIVGLAGPILDWLCQGKENTRYLHYPIADGKKIPDLRIPYLMINEILKVEDAKVMIFCNAGRNRSSFLSAIVLIGVGWSPADAIEHIRKIRPNALANEYFVAALLGAQSRRLTPTYSPNQTLSEAAGRSSAPNPYLVRPPLQTPLQST